MEYSVDPLNLPTEPMNTEQMQDWILFGLMVAGKPAVITRKKLSQIYVSSPASTPFKSIEALIDADILLPTLQRIKTGQYQRLDKAFRQVVLLDLDNLTLESLEAIPGLGPKTARMTLLYQKPGVEVAPLDTHVLKHLKALGYEKVPKSTPPAGKSYLYWESVFIQEAKKSGMSVRAYDTMVWQRYQKGSTQ
jgi:hypothetical protein